MASNRITEYHQQWIGYLNPTGLVFAPNALENAQVVINEGVIAEQREFLAFVTKTTNEGIEFTGFENTADLFFKVLNWRESDLNTDKEIIGKYSFSHPQFGEVVSPTYVAKVNDEKVILIQELDQDAFDRTAATEDNWNSSPHFKFERLLREKQVSTGIMVTKKKLRLIFAPRGESSGYIDFAFKIMYQPSGRLVFSAFRELLSDAKIFNSSKGQSLIEILELSRKYQAQVSIELSGQVLAALYELLRGFQTANEEESGKLLETTLKENPQLIYEGLLTTLLRMVFIMYAEDRNLLATDEIYQSSYSLAALYERLRQDEAQNPDTMDSRYGAWAHLISLFRLIYDGAEYNSEKGKVVLPARHGHLFDPSIYLFLEGRQSKNELYNKSPKISDGVVFRVLKNLLVLNGERISYRTLDVEQIGSVYETMMGFELGTALGETVALKPAKPHGAPLPINLDEILSTKDKAKKIGEVSELKLSDKLKKELNACKTIEEIERVLDKRIDRRATPFRLSKGAMVLIPSEARRKSGSHYTPRELTEPVVRVALEPILKNLGETLTPQQILDLKICDPAMGSGAFLVEACRQLSEKLVESWATHKIKIFINADEDELLHARRLIVQKCLYGVDKNYMAVNLAKLSLWLVTLAKDHSFSFLDHNLKHGDSLIGLTNKQIMAFDYADRTEGLPLFQYVKDQLNEALEARDEIINATDERNYDALKLVEAEYLERLKPLRLVGSLALKCFFDGKNEKERSKQLQKHSLVISNFFAANDFGRLGEYCLKNLDEFDSKNIPFHWELEYPEVLGITKNGFDCFIGNPPFAGIVTIGGSVPENYSEYLRSHFIGAKGKADIISYFFRRSFDLLNAKGTLGFISTNTISQGDTRESSLEQIVRKHGEIYSAVKRIKWPGTANVVVSAIHISKMASSGNKKIDGKLVRRISCFLIEGDNDFSPNKLLGDKIGVIAGFGNKTNGKGFIFDKKEGDYSSFDDLKRLQNEQNSILIRPFISGSDLNNFPEPFSERWVIDIGDRTEEELKNDFPEIYKHLSEKVKPKVKRGNWWQFEHRAKELLEDIDRKKLNSFISVAYTSDTLGFSFIPSSFCISDLVVAFSSDSFALFSILQSTVHSAWVRLYASTMKDDIRYVPGDCFETFPIISDFKSNSTLANLGDDYFKFRKNLMQARNIGLTKIYNLYNDPDVTDPEIIKFRELHQKVDQAVFSFYGWDDLVLNYQFVLDYEEEDDDSDSGRKKQRPVSYRFSPELHDVVLERLLKLNRSQFEEEVRLGLHKR